MKWIRNWWYKIQRKSDITILWPELKKWSSVGEQDLDKARTSFARQVLHDNCWKSLGSEEAHRIINELK